jgi:hypothetical protein
MLNSLCSNRLYSLLDESRGSDHSEQSHVMVTIEGRHLAQLHENRDRCWRQPVPPSSDARRVAAQHRILPAQILRNSLAQTELSPFPGSISAGIGGAGEKGFDGSEFCLRVAGRQCAINTLCVSAPNRHPTPDAVQATDCPKNSKARWGPIGANRGSPTLVPLQYVYQCSRTKSDGVPSRC